MDIAKASWADYKDLLVKKNPNWQHDEGSDSYALYFEDGLIIYSYTLPKSSPPSADQTDWETNFKPRSNFATGKRSYAFASGDFDFLGDGMYAVCAAGQTKEIEYVLTENLYINGGVIVLEGSVIGDWIEVHVVHPVYGPIKTYIKKRYVPASPAGQASPLMEVKTPYAGYIPSGLKLRLIYHSVGASDVKIAANYDLHKGI